MLLAGLERLGGRSIVNSVNYEDGDGPGSRFQRTMALVREHGAAVVALCIDEEGQARTAEWKVRIADRLIRDLTANHGMDQLAALGAKAILTTDIRSCRALKTNGSD